MRVVLFANNRLGSIVTEYLRAQGEDIAGLVLHPPARRKFGEEITAAAGVAADRVFDASRLSEPEVREALSALKADLGISVLFGYLLRREMLSLFPAGCINLHPSLLPFNRGAFPNVWSIVESTPAGVTLHYIDEGVDTGDIIAQRAVPSDAADTGGILYEKLELAAAELFRQSWPLIRAGEAPRFPQDGNGTSHRVRDAALLDEIDLERTYKARDLLNILRARTCPPYHGAFFREGDQKIYIDVSLTRAEAHSS